MSESGVKISVIIPVHNSEKYLEKCLESVILQKYQNWEAFV
ncbi:glycosyltransferase, partial [Bacillus cereus]